MKNPIIHPGCRRSRFHLLIFILILSLCAISVFLVARLRPLIRPIATARAKSIASVAINSSVDRILSADGVTYDTFITLDKDSENRVTALKTDSTQINRLKSKITSEILARVEDLGSTEIGIPVGMLLDNELFSGLGPKIRVSLLPVGYVETDIINRFQAAGINQTIHQIVLDVNVTIGIVMPTYTEYATVNTSVILGESVLLGVVPQNYTNITTDEDIWDKINNFLEFE